MHYVLLALLHGRGKEGKMLLQTVITIETQLAGSNMKHTIRCISPEHRNGEPHNIPDYYYYWEAR